MSVNSLEIETMIKEYNRILIKFKNSKCNFGCSLNLLDKEKNFD